MRALTRLALPALALGAFALSQPAVAGTTCVGERSLQYVCLVNPDWGIGSTTYCFYTGGPECTPVDVPTTTSSGSRSYVYCGGIVPCHQEIVDGCTILGTITCQ